VHDAEVVEIGDDLGERRHKAGGALELEGADRVERVAPDELCAQHDAVVVGVTGDEFDDPWVSRAREQICLVSEP
jgi:hypothetical protein